MPLHCVIDGYNIINHTAFIPLRKKIKDHQRALLEFLRARRLGRCSKNEITVVFDGYPKIRGQNLEESGIHVVFSRDETADTRIKSMVEASKNPRNITVVSDDREIISFIKSVGAKGIGVEDFINPETNKSRGIKEEPMKQALNYSQIDRINRELKALWLKD